MVDNNSNETNLVINDNVGHFSDFNGNLTSEGEKNPLPSLGDWCWCLIESNFNKNELTDRSLPGKEGKYQLGCVNQVGTNFIEVSFPNQYRSLNYNRYLIKDCHKKIVMEHDGLKVIEENITLLKGKLANTMTQIKSITNRLGVANKLTNNSELASSGKDLVVLGQHSKVEDYKDDLVKAKEETLPRLFDEMKKLGEQVSMWVNAESLSYSSEIGLLTETINNVDNRLLNVSLYAGLSEECVPIKDGKPADFHEKVHIMQRKLFMDEECLLDYDAGGMEFRSIDKFDQWLSRKDNFERIFGHQRCVVSFQVRRNEKLRYSNDLLSAFINFNLKDEDKLTFIYVRNGERLYRITTDIRFGDMLFPSDSVMFNEPMMAKVFAGGVERLMPVREYESIRKLYEESKKKHEAWKSEHNEESDYLSPFFSMMTGYDYQTQYFFLVDSDSIYLDDVNKKIEEEVEQYNRITLIIQGLLDRSDVFYPHPPAKLSNQQDFESMISLIFDAEHVLTYGEEPDFEDYRRRCNEQVTKDSVFVGQHQAWLQKKEGLSFIQTGPGRLAIAEKLKPRAKRVVFSWLRDKSDYSGHTRCLIDISLDAVLNVSAYQKGDYKRFYQDVRTRADYLKWAPFLLAAEDYVNGKEMPKLPNTF